MAEDSLTETLLGYSIRLVGFITAGSDRAQAEFFAGRTRTLESKLMDYRCRTLTNEEVANILREKEQEGLSPWLKIDDHKLKLAYNPKHGALIEKIKFLFTDEDTENSCEAYAYLNLLPTDETLTSLLNDYLSKHPEITELDISNTPVTDNLYIPSQLKKLDIRDCKNLSRIPRTSAKVLYTPSLMEIIECPKQVLVSTENNGLELMTRALVQFFGPHVENYVHRAMSDPRFALSLTRGTNYSDDPRLKLKWDSWGYTCGKDVPEMKLIFDLMYLALNGVYVSEKMGTGF